jgi:hypothetical protein
MAKAPAVWMVAASALFLCTAVVGMANMPPKRTCRSEQPTKSRLYQTGAMWVEVEPWLGPHHVYGVFMVPLQYRRHRLYTTTLMIEGFTDVLSNISPEAGPMPNLPAVQGQYIMRVNLPTRTALWALWEGRFGDLKLACNWRLVVEDRVPN